MGIETKSCGPLKDGNGDIRWISGAANSADEQYKKGLPTGHSYMSGPCCPNGHTYGWYGAEHNSTEQHTKVQVVNGIQTKPFRIRRFLR